MDLLTVLDSIDRGQSISAKDFRLVLSQGYAIHVRGKLVLTDYGRTVKGAFGKAA
jgi:hypothetical protein